jgi:hypothetical protein
MAKNKEKSEASAAEVSETKKKEIPSTSFEAEFEGVQVEYKFKAYAFILDGKTITAAEALNDEKILARLVKIKSGVIAPVE